MIPYRPRGGITQEPTYPYKKPTLKRHCLQCFGRCAEAYHQIQSRTRQTNTNTQSPCAATCAPETSQRVDCSAKSPKSQEPRAENQEPRVKSQDPRAKSQEPRATQTQTQTETHTNTQRHVCTQLRNTSKAETTETDTQI